MFQIQMGEEEYRIVSSDGQEGPVVPYGEIATLKIGKDYYYADVEDENSQDVKICRVDSVTLIKTEMIEAEFDDEEDEEEEEEEASPDTEEEEEEEVEIPE
jgi:hypothetical protein